MGGERVASADRQAVLEQVAERIEAVGARPVRVGIDGVDGAGKSRFGDELAAVLRARGHVVLRASVDDFHHPREVRYRRGRDDPEGYWRDSFDLDAFRALLLDPLGPGGDGRVVRAIHDVHAEAAVPHVMEDASDLDVAIVDGIFLHRDELVDHWDLSVWLEVPFEVSIARMAGRDGGDPDASAAANRRYVGGQRRYLDTCDPASRATLVIDNRDLGHPTLSTRTPDEGAAVAPGWLPDDFDHPTRVEVDDDHHLRPIRADDVGLDMVAVMGSQERLWAIHGRAWGWPPATMTREQDREDLARHEAEMVTHESFNYALFDTEETALLGCVYVDPPEKVGADAEISWWVVDDLVGSRLERRLDTLVPTWIATDWPLSHPRYVGRDLSWDDWLALPDRQEADPPG